MKNYFKLDGARPEFIFFDDANAADVVRATRDAEARAVATGGRVSVWARPTVSLRAVANYGARAAATLAWIPTVGEPDPFRLFTLGLRSLGAK